VNSSKLKWFLIIIFLAANIFFIAQYKTYSTDVSNYTPREIELASEILSKGDSPVKADIIPKKKTTENVLRLEFDEHFHDDIAHSILSSDFASYVLPEGIAYTKGGETLLFTDEHTFVYTAFSDKDIQKTVESVIMSGKTSANSSKLLNSLTKKINLPSSVTLSLVSAREKSGYTYITANERVNGFTIDRAVVNALFHNGDIVYIDGTVFLPDKVSSFSSDALDIINLLFNIDTQGSEIMNIEELYYPVTTDGATVYLTPSFKITYKNGEVHLWDSTSAVQRY